MRLSAAIIFLFLFFPRITTAQQSATETVKEAAEAHIEIELDPYYASAGLYKSLTGKPIPHLSAASEIEIYRELVKKFYLPRTAVLEASINPLPYAGTLIRAHQPGLYRSAKVSDNLNLVEAVTAGFEEPWALSLFFGNVINFDSIKKSYRGKRTGYSGILISGGNYHIQHNKLIKDAWVEVEGKLKGEQYLQDRTLRWSFRAGLKTHDNSNITDSFYLGCRRSRTDFGSSKNFWLNNSGFEYVADFSRKNFGPIRHFFLVEKKFLAGRRTMFSLGTGFIWTSGEKYTGKLTEKDSGRGNFQIMIRPNLEF
ncbi:MAG: hypothetical protein HY796_10080 [Elusimicrobia bacterium]|nr:hypothetical protein [Elusimicrobiota bacterium]